MTPVIRTLRPGDTDIIRFIKVRLSEHWLVAEAEVENKYIRPSFSGGSPYIFIALAPGGELMGKVLLIIEPEGYLGIKNQAWITGLFVKEEFRNQGIAQNLIETAEAKCRELGYKELYLDTASAADYYRHIGGWQEIGKDFWEEGQASVIIMKKDLKI